MMSTGNLVLNIFTDVTEKMRKSRSRPQTKKGRKKLYTCPLCGKKVLNIVTHLQVNVHNMPKTEASKCKVALLNKIGFKEQHRSSKEDKGQDRRLFRICPICGVAAARIDKHLQHSHPHTSITVSQYNLYRNIAKSVLVESSEHPNINGQTMDDYSKMDNVCNHYLS